MSSMSKRVYSIRSAFAGSWSGIEQGRSTEASPFFLSCVLNCGAGSSSTHRRPACVSVRERLDGRNGVAIGRRRLMPRQVLLSGSLLPPTIVSETPDASEADPFQNGLLRGLLRCGVDNAIAVTAQPVAAVPPRKVFVKVPPIKPVSIHMSLKRAHLPRDAEGVMRT